MKLAKSVGLGILLSIPVYPNEVPFTTYVEGLKQQALDEGISQSTINEAFADVTYRPRAVKADKSQPEKKLTLDQYIPRAVPQWKIE